LGPREYFEDEFDSGFMAEKKGEGEGRSTKFADKGIAKGGILRARKKEMLWGVL
jgi:hypothetical protein